MKRVTRLGVAAAAALSVASWLGLQAGARVEGEWVAGDFHQHTTYTDGSNSITTVMLKNHQFGLDWWANSEHGGFRATDGRGELRVTVPYDLNDGHRWTDPLYYPVNPIIGDGARVNMWRWQSIRDYSFQDVLDARDTYPETILQGLEWNVPGHEHCSMGLIAGQFSPTPSAAAIADMGSSRRQSGRPARRRDDVRATAGQQLPAALLTPGTARVPMKGCEPTPSNAPVKCLAHTAALQLEARSFHG